MSEAQTQNGADAPKGDAKPAEPAAGDKKDAGAPTSPDGKVTLDERAGLAARYTAYDILVAAAERVAAEVTNDIEGLRVAIVADRAIVGADWQFRWMEAQIAGLQAQLTEAATLLTVAAEPAEGDEAPKELKRFVGAAAIGLLPALASAGTAVGAVKTIAEGVAAVAALARTDHTITSVAALDIGATPLVTAVAGALREQGATVSVDGAARVKSKIVDDFFALHASRDVIAAALLTYTAAHLAKLEHDAEVLRAELDATVAAHNAALAEKKPGADAVEQKVGRLATKLRAAAAAAAPARGNATVAKAVLDRADAFIAAATASEGGAPPPLAVAASREWVREDDTKLHDVLFVELDGAGAELITDQGIWPDDDAVAMGGVVISWMLLNPHDGTVRRAGTEPVLGRTRFSLKDGAVSELQLS